MPIINFGVSILNPIDRRCKLKFGFLEDQVISPKMHRQGEKIFT